MTHKALEAHVIVKDGKRVYPDDEAKRRRKFQKMMRDAGYVRAEDMAPACVYYIPSLVGPKSIVDIDVSVPQPDGSIRPLWAVWLERGETPPPF